MNHTRSLSLATAMAVALFNPFPANADNEHGPRGPVRADSHAPIGVMGEHMHKKGEWMVSYRFAHMDMGGNRAGTQKVSPEEIVTTTPNPFFGAPMQPPTLRVVPVSMTMDMHMAGAMYAPTDWITLMVMAMYVEKEMDHITFQGPMGTAQLGTFTTRSNGFGDTKIAGLIRLFDDGVHRIHLNAGLSLPTGGVKETGSVLTPMGMTPTVRLPYAMQIGSGTVDLMPGITYTARDGGVSWGAQYGATIRLGDNGQDYALGDMHRLTAWASYSWAPWISLSLRVAGETASAIDGRDMAIMAPVQTADPANYGGDRIDVFFGINLAGQKGVLHNHRLAIELGVPVYQKLNGPQMERDWQITVGYQKAF